MAVRDMEIAVRDNQMAVRDMDSTSVTSGRLCQTDVDNLKGGEDAE